MKTRILVIVLVSALLVILSSSLTAEAAWDSYTQKWNPVKGQAVGYDNASCKGDPYIIFYYGTTYKDLRSWCGSRGVCNWNDRISCLTVGPYTKLIVFQHINYGGNKWTINNNNDSIMQKNLGGAWWDNSISSVQVW